MIIKKPQRLEELENIISSASGIDKKEFSSLSRNKEKSQARFMLWYIAHDYMGYGLVELGVIYNKDHSTILAACKRMRKNKEAKEVVEKMCKKIPNLISEKTIKDWKF